MYLLSLLDATAVVGCILSHARVYRYRSPSPRQNEHHARMRSRTTRIVGMVSAAFPSEAFFQRSVIIGRPKCREQTGTYDSKCRPDSLSCSGTENNIHVHFPRHLIAGALRMSGYYVTYMHTFLPTIRYLHRPFHPNALILAALCGAAVLYRRWLQKRWSSERMDENIVHTFLH